MSVLLVGQISQICPRFYSEGWGWAVVDIYKIEGMPLPKTRSVKVTGTLEGFGVGYSVEVRGERVEHPTFGVEVKAEHVIEHSAPASEEGFVTWMSHRLPNVGPVRAAELWRRFSHDIWSLLEEPSVAVPQLSEMNGITEERAKEICDAYRVYKHERQVIVDLLEMGFRQAEAHVLYKKLKRAATGMARDDPYEICLRGYLPFARVDAVVMKRPGADIGAPKRVLACATVEARRLSQSTGNTILLREKLEEDVAAELSLYVHIVHDAIEENTKQEKKVFVPWGTHRLMLASTARDEQSIADFIRRRT